MHRSIHVDIMGRTYPLRVHEDSEDLMRRIAEYVDEKLQTIQENLPDRPELTVAIVGALSIAEELFVERGRSPVSVEELDKSLSDLSAQLAKALDEEDESS